VVVVITGGHLKFTDQNGKITEVYAKAGESRWFPPFKHRVENLGDEPYNAVYIGIKKGLGENWKTARELEIGNFCRRQSRIHNRIYQLRNSGSEA
jgi:hypothetical protein